MCVYNEIMVNEKHFRNISKGPPNIKNLWVHMHAKGALGR
jgi:hypothetical protein